MYVHILVTIVVILCGVLVWICAGEYFCSVWEGEWGG